MTDVPDTYDPDSIEPRWQQQWQESGVYRHEGDAAPDYVVDTPPPYPTGNFHIGNALGWCYMDFVARYRRLQGDDVLFPQGWDCHGLPTEVKVEEEHGIQRTDVSRERFRELCVEHTDEQIAAMRETMLELGFSQDWSAEFRTMDPDYWGQTQRSFVEMADAGYVYRDEHPVNWCPRCRTAIADAEVEDHQREGTLYTVRFPGVDGDPIEIATTRPELLSACVGMAVHPDDERYADRVGDAFEVPLFGQEVELLADDAVDPEFGTGAVMICTFGDKQDVEWWAEYDLGLRPVFAADGTLTDLAREYEGLSVEEARTQVPADLDEEGLLVAEEPVDQHVGVCWRCDTPIEIVSEEQWFVEVRKEEILDTAREAEWIPEHMFDRLAEWTEGMDWDWVISRQRVFATPIPAWFCDDCGAVHLASVEELPVDPTETDPAVGECPDCGGGAASETPRDGGGETAGATSWTGETDVMDTWMDSSISALHVAGWPEASFEPVQLREQGHDIIRTWAFYSVLRTAALVESVPWERALINGMVMGEDGHKMSKSRGNYVQPEEAVEEGSADAFRQAMALGGQPGSDVTFQWKEVTAATRLLTKLWNVFRFTAEHVDGTTPDVQDPAYRDADRWLLSRLSTVADDVEAAMDEFRFDVAMRRLRSFVWEDLADDYVELVKGRLYNGPPGERNAARHSLYTALSAVVRMLAPFCPHVAEEIHHHLPGTEGSVHEADWPTVEMVDEEAEHAGDVVTGVARAVRAWKSERGMALNETLDRVEVYLDDPPERAIDTYDLSETVSAPAVVEGGVPDVELQPVAVEPNHAELGPAFREDAEDVVAALADADPAEVAGMARRGEVILDVDGETVSLDPEMVEVVEEYRAATGEAVDVLETEHATVLVVP